jgi:Phytanoyl-CoA dioxygenase (PhyH)
VIGEELRPHGAPNRLSGSTVGRRVIGKVPLVRELVLGAKSLRDARLRAPRPRTVDPRVQQWLVDVRRSGLCVVHGYLSASACARLRAEVADQMKHHAGRVIVDARGADHRLFLGPTPPGGLGTIFDDPLLVEAARGVLGGEVTNVALLAGWIRARPKNRGSGGGWHRDSYTNQFKAMLYLTDVDERSGPFQFILGSHRTAAKARDDRRMGLEMGRRPRIPNKAVRRLIDSEPERLTTVIAARGTLILVDTTGIHRGMPIARGERVALTNYYYPTAVVKTPGFRPRFNIVTVDP